MKAWVHILIREVCLHIGVGQVWSLYNWKRFMDGFENELSLYLVCKIKLGRTEVAAQNPIV